MFTIFDQVVLLEDVFSVKVFCALREIEALTSQAES